MFFRVASSVLRSGHVYSGHVRRPMAALLTAILAVPVAGAPAIAASQCGMSPARQAFDVEGLKSELMVTALSCNTQDRYNAFIAKFRPDLMAQEHTLTAYFTGAYGRTAQKEHDDYITQLANVQSERGLQAGTAFCDQRMSMFDEVAVLDTASDLGSYAEAKDIVQPAIYETCGTPVAVKASRVRRGRAASRNRHRS